MRIEYEATFENINKEKVRKKLKEKSAKLIKPEFLQKRLNFYLPKGSDIEGGWLRIRDEQDKITMSLKVVDGTKIENQKEVCLEVKSFNKAKLFLESIGCEQKTCQESKRELWKIGDVEISIDEWPFLEPFLEIEGSSEEPVKEIAQKLGFDYKKALFCSVDTLYNRKYKVSKDFINNKTDIVFCKENPFLNNNEK